ncbi:MAG: hypothetical protein QW250_07495, partial [Sulfolobaceae archaeon]
MVDELNLFQYFNLPFQIELILGFITLAISAELISISAEKLSVKFGQGFTGGIIIGLVTALPETLFVIIAVLNNRDDVAIGSALGANVILFTFGIGMLGILYTIKWRKQAEISKEYKIEERYLLISNLALIIVYLVGFLNYLLSLAILIIYFSYVYERYKIYRSNIFSGNEEKDKNVKVGLKYFLMLTLGSLLIILSSEIFVEGLARASSLLDISAGLIALIITPIASELEEKISSFRLVLRSPNNFTIALLSFIGSKIENMTLLIGLVGLLSNNDFIPVRDYSKEFISAIITTFIALYVLIDRKIRFLESFLLVLSYFIIIFI